MTVLGVKEAVTAEGVYDGSIGAAVPTTRECTDAPGFMSLALSAAVVGFAGLTFSSTPALAANTSVRGTTVGELSFSSQYLRPTPGLSDAMAALRASVEQMGTKPVATPELRALAVGAVHATDARRNENVDEWARRLAADVANADD